jgi:hypothetical protein
VEVSVIPCQWRAADIVCEIHEHAIRYETILIDHRGELVEFHRGGNPEAPLDANATNDIARLAGAVMPGVQGPLEGR